MKSEFYKMEYEAWDEGTDLLTLEQEGAYLRLCHQMYRRRGPVPDEPRTLCRVWRCHLNKARKLLDDLVAAGKVDRVDGYLTNNRVTQELEARDAASRQRADAGRTGGTHTQENRRKSLSDQAKDQSGARTRRNQSRGDESRGDESRGPPNAPKGLIGCFRMRIPLPSTRTYGLKCLKPTEPSRG
jgi:uncharacterized protein YdaU (DUF1376 family)